MLTGARKPAGARSECLRIALLLLSAAVAWGSVAGRAQQSAPPGWPQPSLSDRADFGIKQIQRRPGVTLNDLLRTIPESDRARITTLEVVEHIDPFLPVLDENGGRLSVLAQQDVVAVVRINAIDSRANADGSWLDSTVHATIEELWRTTETGRRVAPAAGATIAFEWWGGETRIDGVRVVARPFGFLPLERERVYLLFGFVGEGQSLRVPLSDLYAVQGSRVRSLQVTTTADDVEAKTVDSLRATLRMESNDARDSKPSLAQP